MKIDIKIIGALAIIILIVSSLCFTGCRGSESREKVDEAVETVSGKKQVEQMNKMKNDIQKAQEKADERMKSQMDEENQ